MPVIQFKLVLWLFSLYQKISAESSVLYMTKKVFYLYFKYVCLYSRKLRVTWGDYPDLAYTWMLLLLSARASLWLLINLSASHERTRRVTSISQCEQQAQDHSSGLMNCYCSAANWYCWYKQPNLIPTWWKSLWTNSITTNVCEGADSPLKTALPDRLLVFSQDL